jgi:hypothetical protein
MPLPVKICLANIGIALFFALIFEISLSVSQSDFFYSLLVLFGVVSFVGGVVDAIISLFLFLLKKNQIGYGFLLSAGVLILLGAIITKTV